MKFRRAGLFGLAAALAAVPSVTAAQSQDWSAQYPHRGESGSKAKAGPKLPKATLAQLAAAIARQAKPHWSSPPDAQNIRSSVAFELNEDGSLKGEPVVIRQIGVVDGQGELAAEHGRRAMEAVIMGAPYELPREFYSAWKKVTLTFDWRL